MGKVIQGLARKYLSNKGYFIRPPKLPKPKIGDEITFRNGGDWVHNTFYTTTATVTKFDKNHPERPFEKYGYMYVENRGKSKELLYYGVVHPYNVIDVKKARNNKPHSTGN